METIEQLLAGLPADAPRGLRARILGRIAEAAEVSARRYRTIAGAAALMSAAAAFEGIALATRSLSGSAFASYFSLLFTDGGAMLAYWKELAFSLLESAPLTAVTVVIASVFAFLASVRAFARYADEARHFAHGLGNA